MRLRRRPHKVTIVYKSGAIVVIRCRNLTVERRGAELRSVEWENAKPRPLLFGVDEVVSIWTSKP